MSRLDFCEYELVDDCYDWKNDNCDGCNIFKAYCEGARMAKASIVRCKDCRWQHTSRKSGRQICAHQNGLVYAADDNFCSHAERRSK